MTAALDIIKKNMLSIICAVVAILAMVAVFVWPLPAKFSELQDRLKAREGELASLDALSKKVRKMPRLDPAIPEVKDLTGFPTQKVIDAGNTVVAGIASEAKATSDLAVKLNEHQLLVPDSLPAASEPVGYEYISAYTRAIDYTNADPSVRNGTLPVKVLKAGIPASLAEIEAEKLKRREEITKNELVPGVNDKAIADKIAKMELTIADTLKAEIAGRSLMYMDTAALDIYPGVIGLSRPPVASTIYYSQIGLWVQQDVCAGLAAANAGSGGVATSAVKHLVKLEVSETGGAISAAPADGSVPTGRPSLSGRTSNDKYDVIPFRLIMYVDATRAPQVLAELARNKLITVLKCDLTSVDIGAQLALGYYYGESPAVVMLTLDCEELFLKSWLSKFVPPTLTQTPAPQ